MCLKKKEGITMSKLKGNSQKMKKKIILLILLVVFLISCKSASGPAGPQTPTETSGVFEILYERVLEIKNPAEEDPTNYLISFHHDSYGGESSSRLATAGENKWQAEVKLQYSNTSYAVWLYDKKVEKTKNKSIARKISMRPKGSNTWVELICIEANALDHYPYQQI